MSGTYAVVMGDRGRLVIPVEVREHAGLAHGTRLIMIETPDGIVLLTRAQLQDHVRRELEGSALVESLLEDRRRAAAVEDGAPA